VRPRSVELRGGLLGVAAVAFVLLLPVSAGAAPEPSASATRFRLHGRLDLLSFHHYDPNGPGIAINNLGLGLGRTTLADSGLDPYGLVRGVRPFWSLGFGVALLQSRLNIGAKFAVLADLGWIRDDREGSSDRSTIVSGTLVPYLRWIFLPGRRYRPFVEAHVGLGGGALSYDENTVGTRGTKHMIWPQVGAMGGVHFFVVDGFSIDLGLGLDYWTPFSRRRFEGREGTADEDFVKDGDLVNVAVSCGGSVWFGP
jgi:hypothetical protein